MDGILKASGWALNNVRPRPPSRPTLIAFPPPIFFWFDSKCIFQKKLLLPKSFWNDWGVKSIIFHLQGGVSVCMHIFMSTMYLCVRSHVCKHTVPTSICVNICEPVFYFVCVSDGIICEYTGQWTLPNSTTASICHQNERTGRSSDKMPPVLIHITLHCHKAFLWHIFLLTDYFPEQ